MERVSTKFFLAGLALWFTAGSAQQVYAEEPALKPEIAPATAGGAGIAEEGTSFPKPGDLKPERIKKDYWIAYRLARDPWLDKIVEADPRIVAAICQHAGPAKELAMHKHLDKIAEADHYLCRRLCQWKGATQKLLRNPYADVVISLDPQGMADAISKNPELARLVIKHPVGYEVYMSSSELARETQKHIR